MRSLLLVRKRVLRSSGGFPPAQRIVQWVGVLYSVYSHIITSKAEPQYTKHQTKNPLMFDVVPSAFQEL